MEEESSQQFGYPSLLCEELENKGSQEKKTSEEEEVVREEHDGRKDCEVSHSASQAEEQAAQAEDPKDATNKKQKKSRRTRTKKPNERPKKKRGQKDTIEDEAKVVPTSPEEKSALMEPPVPLVTTCDLPEPVITDCAGLGMHGPPSPIPQVDSPMNAVQPAATKRPPSPPFPQSVSHHSLEPLEMEITQVYSTRRSIRYITHGRGQTGNIPQPPKPDSAEGCPLPPPPPKKKTRTLYSTNQLEHLEALFQEDHYPDTDKRKVIAASVGVTPQRIMVWFQNRRAKWRKVERLVSCKAEQLHNRGRWSPARPRAQSLLPNMQTEASGNIAPVFSGHFGTKMPLLDSVLPVPPFSALSTQTQPSFSQLLATSPGQSRVGEQPDFHPRPMLSPPPLRRASLPLLATSTAFNLNMPPPPPPLFVDEGGSLAQRDSRTLQIDASSLFDFSDKTDFQNNTQLSFQLQTSYPNGPTQPLPPQQLQASASHPPRMAFLTPSPFLTTNPPDDISSSYIAFGPSGSSTYSSGGHTYVQSHGGGQIMMQPNNPGSLVSYPSYPWANMYAQPGVQQLAPSYPAGFAGAARDRQVPSSSASMPPSFQRTYTLGSAVLPPVSTLQPSRLRVENRGAEAAPMPPLQTSPACSPRSPVAPSCVKIESDSPHEIPSHFNCDFSAIHF
ncbi:homeobox protein unc-4 homolog isoform X1 [Corythoichthys intestinalis]|uniref:homeobox protein unc-4 homolog isoform X1 n=1 Tax=Corythoichthys intestinalis TaxID=161448 RepID=UPI0025A53C26|nr:homeobox protein unc-4 homolog isoform X1 [Corythoichthys intestinalis]